MIFNVHAGHNAIIQGTSGNGLQEHVECRKIKDRVISGLRSQGHTVHDTTDERGTTIQMVLSNVCTNCKQNKVDKGISIHMNASNGQGHGVEVWCYDENGRAEANRISKSIADATGLSNRGVKIAQGKDSKYVISNVAEPVFLIECYFMDNTNDSNIYKSIGSQRFGDIIVQAITGKGVDNMAEQQVSDWAKQAQEWVKANGVSDGTRPQDGATREEIWTMLYNMNK